MIGYESGPWHVAFIFRLKGSIFPKALAWSIPAALLSAALDKWFLDPINSFSASQVWTAYNFTLGFLIVFRTQQAYSRFWEGSTLLQQIRAEWFNAISSCFAFCSTKEDKRGEVKKFQHLLVRLSSLLYCTALQQIAILSDEAFEVLDLDGISEDSLDYLATAPDKTLVILQWVQKLIVQAHEDGVITAAPPILSRVYQELSRGIVNVYNAQKITDIVFPFPYAQMVTVSLIVSTCITPIITAMLMSEPIWSGILTFLSVFAYWCINYIAAEIEMPFGEDDNDLPIARYQEGFNMSLRMLLDEQSQNPPEYDFNPLSYHTASARGFACPFELITDVQHKLWESSHRMLVKTQYRNRFKKRRRALVDEADRRSMLASPMGSVSPLQQTEQLRARLKSFSKGPDFYTHHESFAVDDPGANIKVDGSKPMPINFMSSGQHSTVSPYVSVDRACSSREVSLTVPMPITSLFPCHEIWQEMDKSSDGLMAERTVGNRIAPKMPDEALEPGVDSEQNLTAVDLDFLLDRHESVSGQESAGRYECIA